MNYEIYNENGRDKDQCPQYNLMIDKNLNSVQYPHGTLNLSYNNSNKYKRNYEIKSDLKEMK